jgi:hypothetical protein
MMPQAKTASPRLDAIRDEIDRARGDLLSERERLLAARAELERQIGSLEAELRILETLDRASASGGNLGEDAAVRRALPLSQRVIETLQRTGTPLTSRQIREHLGLDQRESRNLGPVLNQLAKLGKVSNGGRGAPWQLMIGFSGA